MPKASACQCQAMHSSLRVSRRLWSLLLLCRQALTARLLIPFSLAAGVYLFNATQNRYFTLFQEFDMLLGFLFSYKVSLAPGTSWTLCWKSWNSWRQLHDISHDMWILNFYSRLMSFFQLGNANNFNTCWRFAQQQGIRSVVPFLILRK